MNKTTSRNRPPDQGQIVEIRQRRYVVTDIQQSALPERLAEDKYNAVEHLVMFSSVEDDALGEELRVVWQIEVGRRVYEKVSLPSPMNGFDPPIRLDAFLDAVRCGAASLADVRSLQSPFRSSVVIEDYQLDPLVRARPDAQG